LTSKCVSTPPVTRRGATLRSRRASTPPVTGRTASTMVTVIPSACRGVKGWRRRPTARRRCDRPVGAGRSTALRASAGATSPGAGRRIVLKTGTPSTDSRAKPEPSEGDGTPPPTAKVADCHRSPSLRHSRSWRRSASLHILPADSALLVGRGFAAVGRRRTVSSGAWVRRARVGGCG